MHGYVASLLIVGRYHSHNLLPWSLTKGMYSTIILFDDVDPATACLQCDKFPYKSDLFHHHHFIKYWSSALCSSSGLRISGSRSKNEDI